MQLDRFRRNAAARGQPRDAARHRARTSWGIPLVHIDCTHGENERRIAERANRDAVQMLIAAGFENVAPLGDVKPPGQSVHEMGTARMGRDPRTSVLNRPQPGARRAEPVHHRRLVHDFVAARVNPSLTYMALSARAANYAADLLASGEI